MTTRLSLDEILFAEEPHRYIYRGREYQSVTQVIRAAGFGEDFSAVPSDRMEFCQRRGRMVHLATQLFDHGELDMRSVDDRIRPYLDSYIKFTEACPGKNVAIEQRLVVPFECMRCGHDEASHDRVGCNVARCRCTGFVAGLGLAGTPDRIRFVRGYRSVIDLKTANPMGKSTRWQTAAYAKLWNTLFPNQPVHHRYGLRLRKDGEIAVLIPYDDPTDESAFLDMLDYSRAKSKVDRWTRPSPILKTKEDACKPQ